MRTANEMSMTICGRFEAFSPTNSSASTTLSSEKGAGPWAGPGGGPWTGLGPGRSTELSAGDWAAAGDAIATTQKIAATTCFDWFTIDARGFFRQPPASAVSLT